jgi:hypothetical protein
MMANNATLKRFFFHTQISSENVTTLNAHNLLLPSVQDDSAIMIAANASYSLQLIVESFSTGAKQDAPVTICNDSFKFIDASASEGARFALYL